MTGRDLIIYIMTNHLEDEEVFKDGMFVGFMTAEEVALKFGVGVNTINTWLWQGKIKGVKIGNTMYFTKDVIDPRNMAKEA